MLRCISRRRMGLE